MRKRWLRLSAGPAGDVPDQRRRGVTLRALLIAGLIAPINSWWLYQMQEVRYVGNPTAGSLYYNVFFIIVVLTLGNTLLRRIAPARALAQSELLVIYTVLCITSSCAGYDGIHWIIPDTAGVHYRATPETRWREVFFQYLPRDLTMGDPGSLKLLFEGDTSFYADPRAWRPWVAPGLWWMTLMSTAWLAPLGFATVVRRRWSEVERLPYPIAQVPLEVTRDRPTIVLQPAFWIAFGAVIAVKFIHGMKALNPAFPAIPLGVSWEAGGSPGLNISAKLTDPPWSAASDICMTFYPMIIGLGLLLPTELTLSCWLFFCLFKGQQVLVSWLGIRGDPDFPYVKEQSLGGYLGILGFSLWVGRAYYASVLRRILKPDPTRDAAEPSSFRWAAVLSAACFAAVVLVVWSAGPDGMKPGAGMLLSYALLHWVIYYVNTMVCGRLRAEMGVPNHEIERLGPVVMLGNVFGVLRRGKVDQSVVRSLTVASPLFALSRGMRSAAFPHELEGLWLMGRSGGDRRRLYRAMIVAVVLGVVIAWAVYLPTVYHYGAATARMKQYSDWATNETYGQLMNWIENPKGFAPQRVVPTIIGFGVFWITMTLRTSCSWWPIHPIGLALSTTYGMLYWWCPFLIAWVVKSLATRYGGHHAGAKLAAIAYGLILADTVGGCLWTIYGAITQKQVYAF